MLKSRMLGKPLVRFCEGRGGNWTLSEFTKHPVYSTGTWKWSSDRAGERPVREGLVIHPVLSSKRSLEAKEQLGTRPTTERVGKRKLWS